MNWQLWLIVALIVFAICARIADKCKKCGSRRGFNYFTGGNWSGSYTRRYCKKCGENDEDYK